MDRTEERKGERVPLATLDRGGGCSCGCCGSVDDTPDTSVEREREIAELKELREATERRLAELDAE